MSFDNASIKSFWLALAMLAAGELKAGQGVGFSNFFSLDLRPATTISETDDTSVPDQPRLAPLFPNPFNSTTRLEYHLPESRDGKHEVRLSIYSIQGQLVRRLLAGELPAGRYAALWDGRSDSGRKVGSGVYIAFMTAGSVRVARKILFLQ